jgi:8-oxo-dGTP pyrophosphatase MutT (NUDIX family)
VTVTGDRLASVLATRQPFARWDEDWGVAGPPMRLAIAAYHGPAELPAGLVTSVRVIVGVGDEIILCTNVNGRHHVWPGGRIEAGETVTAAAVREVHEETGWHVDPASVTPLGFLHLRHGAPPPEGYRFPHPDFLQVVVAATASRRDTGPDGGAWTDLDDGFELASRLVPATDLDHLGLTAAEPVFVRRRPGR